MRSRLHLPISCRDYIVYSLRDGCKTSIESSASAETMWADSHTTTHLFSGDGKLQRRFLGFLESDCLGVFQVIDGEWVSYAWMTKAGSPGPQHMPSPPNSDSCWIFHCGTKVGFRGRGLYKRSLRLLAMQAEGCGELLIDTEVDNQPSRRAIVSVGFQPYRLVRSWTWTVPRIKSWTFAKWQNGQQLPAMDQAAA